MRHKRRAVVKALMAAPMSLWVPPALAANLPAVGAALTLADFPLLEGGRLKATEAEGRVVAIYWWASWCPFCAEMSPSVEQLWREHRERGLTVLGIAMDKTAEPAIAYRRKRGYTFPSTLYGPAVERLLAKPKAVPTMWVRDRNGRVVLVENGQMFPEDVAAIAKFL